MMTYEQRQALKLAISEKLKEKLPKDPRTGTVVVKRAAR